MLDSKTPKMFLKLQIENRQKMSNKNVLFWFKIKCICSKTRVALFQKTMQSAS